jgi:aryl-alcohol dehydrogenase-like predicted oxidoreductase
MEKRRLGKTGHMSTVLALGGAAFWNTTRAEAEAGVELAMDHGINHIDVAPTYGKAEVHLGPWLEKHRKNIFLACKTNKRNKTEAWEELKQSLERLRVGYFDLYQFHAVDDLETLYTVLGSEGAVEAVLEAKQQGLVRYIGITGHRPFTHVEALKRFDFDTVLFPLNRVLNAHPNDFNDFSTLLKIAQKKDVGTIAIKAITKRPWEGNLHVYQTWYEPFDEQKEIDKSLWYTLSQGVTTCAMSGDLRLWPMLIDAAERFRPMNAQEQAEAIAQVMHHRPLFPHSF